MMQIHELKTSLEDWHKEVTRPSIIPKSTGYESKVSSSKNIPTFINFVLSRASCWQNLDTLFRAFRNSCCYCWVFCAAVFSFKHAQRWPFANRDHEGHRAQIQFILVYWVFTVFSVCKAVLVVFYQGLPVYCFYGTASFLAAPRGNWFTVFVKCSRIAA